MDKYLRNFAKKIAPNFFVKGWSMFRRTGAGRQLTVFDDDVYIVSYPKSGNTWLRFLLANLVAPDQNVDFGNIETIVPDIYQHPERRLLNKPRPRLLKSHEYFDPRYRKVIYIVRDPRDVVVSYYHYKKKKRVIAENLSVDSFVAGFLDGKWDRFGAWGENVGSWLGAREHSADFVLLRYEDLLLDPMAEVSKLAMILGVSDKADEIERAVRMSSFRNMQELERTSGARWQPIKGTKPDIAFVRSGVSGGWRDELTEKSAETIKCKWRDLMHRFDYN